LTKSESHGSGATGVRRVAKTCHDLPLTTSEHPPAPRKDAAQSKPHSAFSVDSTASLIQPAVTGTLATRIYGRDDRPYTAYGRDETPYRSSNVSKRLIAHKTRDLESQTNIPRITRNSDGSLGKFMRNLNDSKNTAGPSREILFRHLFYRKFQRLLRGREEGLSNESRQELDRSWQEADVLLSQPNREAIHQIWAKTWQDGNLERLSSFIIGCLAKGPQSTLHLLASRIWIPGGMQIPCLCLSYLDMVHELEIDVSPDLKREFAYQINWLSRTRNWPKRPLEWYVLVLLLRHNTPEHCAHMMDTIKIMYDPTPVRLLLVMVDYCTQHGDAERAVDLLALIPSPEREPHKTRILQRCENIVRIDQVDTSESDVVFRSLARLIKLGLPLNAQIYNSIIERAVQLEQPEVAWEVFEVMQSQEIHADPRSHLFLLQDSFRRNEQQRLNTILTAIHTRDDLNQYPYLVAYMLHIVRVVCRIDRDLPPENSLSHLLAVYDRAYDRAPLTKLGIAPALAQEQSPGSRRQVPPPVVLGFTIWAYVLCQKDERRVSSLWHWIIHLLKQGDETITACAKHDVLYNGFVHFYASSRYFLKKSVGVVETMMEVGLCVPTERTWSEVLSGFLKHGEEESAEKIWRLMIARDVKPTKKGWKFFLEKYEASRVAGVVRYLLQEGNLPLEHQWTQTTTQIAPMGKQAANDTQMLYEDNLMDGDDLGDVVFEHSRDSVAAVDA
jgi:pentatricopeptide repeat protein